MRMPEPSIQDFIVEQTNFFQPEPAWASLSQQDQNRLLQDREQDQFSINLQDHTSILVTL